MDASLTTLGWTETRAGALATLGLGPEFLPGRITAERGDQSLATTAGGDRLVRPPARAERPAIGDWVAIGPEGRLAGILPRTSVIARKVAGRESRSQILAANADVALIVTAADRDWSPRRIERYLIAIWDGGATPAIVVNKVDTLPLGEEQRAALGGIATGVPILEISAATGIGFDALLGLIPPGHTGVLLGSSGVGKSTITNRLLGDAARPTAAVGDEGRGRHTTTDRRLFPIPGAGLLIDTPGLREFVPWASEEGVRAVFAEIEEIAAGCRFRDCAHDTEPDCAVLAAVATGRLDPERLASYRKLMAEQRALEARTDPAAAAELKRRDRILNKAGDKRIREKYGE